MSPTAAAHQLPPWRPPILTPWQRFRRDPAGLLVRWLYRKRCLASHDVGSSESPISIVCISDTHNLNPQVPDGDVLLHAGDLTNGGSFEELQEQLDWLQSLPHRHKVIIAGNHDLLLDPDFVARSPDRIYEGHGTSRADLDWGDMIYLNNTATKLQFANGRSLTIYGSPWTEQLGNWAFQYPPIRQVWEQSVPLDTDILLTHGPPKGHLDLEGKGCQQLLREIWRTRPRLVVFGHVHDGYGREDIFFDSMEATYDGVMMGDKGLFAVVIMACALVWGWLWNALSCPLPNATFVNAAVAPGRQNNQPKSGIVVEL